MNIVHHLLFLTSAGGSYLTSIHDLLPKTVPNEGITARIGNYAASMVNHMGGDQPSPPSSWWSEDAVSQDPVDQSKSYLEEKFTKIFGGGSEKVPTIEEADSTTTTTKAPLVPEIEVKELKQIATDSITVEDRTVEILPDPRLVPHSIYEMKCQPGLLFHKCVQTCLDGRNVEPQGTLGEASKFQRCIDDCRAVYLVSTTEGCMDQTGKVYPRSTADSDDPQTFNKIKFRWKAIWFKVRSFPVMRVMTKFLDTLTVLNLVTVLYLFHYFNIHVAMYTLVNGPLSRIQKSDTGSWEAVEAAELCRDRVLSVLQTWEAGLMDVWAD